MSKRTKSRDVVADPTGRFVILKPPAVELQADDDLEAFDRATEELMAGADRAIAWLRSHGRQKSTLPK